MVIVLHSQNGNEKQFIVCLLWSQIVLKMSIPCSELMAPRQKLNSNITAEQSMSKCASEEKDCGTQIYNGNLERNMTT